MHDADDQSPTAMGYVLSADNSADRFEGGTDESISRRVDHQFVESAGHQAARQELVTFRLERIYPPSNTIQNRLASGEAPAELTSLPPLHGKREDFGDEVWQLVRTIFEANRPDPSRSKQVRRVEHQQPEVSDGYSFNVAVRDHRPTCRRFG